MSLQIFPTSPARALNKAYLKEKVGRNAIETFKQQLATLFQKAAPDCSEDTLKDYITDFFKNT